MMIWGFPH